MSRPSVPCEIRIIQAVVPGGSDTGTDPTRDPCREPADYFFYHAGRGRLIGLCERHRDSSVYAMGDGWAEVLDEDEIPVIQAHSS